MAKRILVPMDGSAQSDDALAFALTEHPDAEITILTVIDPVEGGYTPVSTPGSSEEWYRAAKEDAEALFEEARELAGEHGGTLDGDVETGRPANAIVEYAEEHGVDQIVMGSHGREGVSRILLGSVAETVVRGSPVPVTVVR